MQNVFEYVLQGLFWFWFYVGVVTQDLSELLPSKPQHQEVVHVLPTGPPSPESNILSLVSSMYSFIKWHERVDERMLL